MQAEPTPGAGSWLLRALSKLAHLDRSACGAHKFVCIGIWHSCLPDESQANSASAQHFGCELVTAAGPLYFAGITSPPYSYFKKWGLWMVSSNRAECPVPSTVRLLQNLQRKLVGFPGNVRSGAVYHQWASARDSPDRRGSMSKFAIRLLTLAMYATALVVVPMVTPAKAEASSSRHLKKHKKQKSLGFSDPWSTGQASPVTRPSSQADAVCPGIARSFECRTWPPPMYDDPDRRIPPTDR